MEVAPAVISGRISRKKRVERKKERNYNLSHEKRNKDFAVWVMWFQNTISIGADVEILIELFVRHFPQYNSRYHKKRLLCHAERWTRVGKVNGARINYLMGLSIKCVGGVETTSIEYAKPNLMNLSAQIKRRKILNHLNHQREAIQND